MPSLFFPIRAQPICGGQNENDHNNDLRYPCRRGGLIFPRQRRTTLNLQCSPFTSAIIAILPASTELSMDKSVGAWRFAPPQSPATAGATLNLQNLGGETHTFTRVKRFGGGFVAPLNEGAGTPAPAPECAPMVNGNLVPQPPSPDDTFVPAGTSASITLKPGETARFQCCIHPWMHLTITPMDEHHANLQ